MRFSITRGVTIKQIWSYSRTQGWTKGLTSQAALRGANLHGAKTRHWNNLKFGAIKLMFPHVEEIFPRDIASSWTRVLKNIRQACPRPRKFLTNICLKGAKLIACLRHPQVSDPTLAERIALCVTGLERVLLALHLCTVCIHWACFYNSSLTCL